MRKARRSNHPARPLITSPDVNALLNKAKQKVQDVLIRLQDDGKLDTLSLEELKVYVTQKHTEVMTFSFVAEITAELKQAERFGNAFIYETLLRSISNFTKGKDFPLKQVTYSWLKKIRSLVYGQGKFVERVKRKPENVKSAVQQGYQAKTGEQGFVPIQ
jgi:hypothetical protein